MTISIVDHGHPAGGSGGTPDDNSVTTAKLANGAVTDAKVTSVSTDKLLEGVTYKRFTAADRTKLDGVAPSATQNATDAQLRDRSTHTGTQSAATISDFTEAAQDAIAALLAGASGVTLSYDDAANTLTITGGGAGGLDAEAVRDAIGVALVGVGLISIVVNDAADTITISTTATQNSTDAALRDRSTHTGTQSADTITDGATNKAYTAAEKTKLASIKATQDLPGYAPATLAKPWNPEQARYNMRPAAVRKFRAKAASAAQNIADLHIGVLADSIFASYDGAVYNNSKGLPRRLMQQIAKRLGHPYYTTGVQLSMSSGGFLGDRWVATTGTWTAGITFLYNTTAGAVATLTTPDMCTAVEIYYSNLGAGFTMTVDGVAVAVPAMTGAATYGKVTKTGLTNGYHTIQITAAASGGALIMGQRWWNPNVKQIHFHNLALGGAKANAGSNGYDNYSSMNASNPLGLGSLVTNLITQSGVTLDGLIIEIGNNDVYSGGATAAQVATGITTMRNFWPTVPVIGLIHPPMIPGTTQATFDQLGTQFFTLAETFDCPFYDWNWWVNQAIADIGMAGTDGIHPKFDHQVSVAGWLADGIIPDAIPGEGNFPGVLGLPGGRYRVIEQAGSVWPARPNVPAGLVDFFGADQPPDMLDGDTWDDLP